VCVARNTQKISAYPLKRPRREREIWLWRPIVIKRRDEILLVENTYAPFLKGHWILPGKAQRQVPSTKATPVRKKITFKGTVTHHDILVFIEHPNKGVEPSKGASKWVKIAKLKREVPASLIRRAIVEGLKLEPPQAKRSKNKPQRQEKSQR
jgi:A/G-specific adenine glycosylase